MSRKTETPKRNTKSSSGNGIRLPKNQIKIKSQKPARNPINAASGGKKAGKVVIEENQHLELKNILTEVEVKQMDRKQWESLIKTSTDNQKRSQNRV